MNRSLQEREAFQRRERRHIWLWWVLAYTAGEIIGFGLGGSIAAGAMQGADQVAGALAVLLMIGAGIVAGAVEGSVVGYAQWLVLRRILPKITWQQWVGATAAGAVVAWIIGMSLGAFSASLNVGEVSDVAVMASAALLGLALGALLGTAQWLVLRRYVLGAGWWIYANALAWLLGMVIAFAGAGSVSPEQPALLVVTVTTTGVLMGALVGAITGSILIALFRPVIGSYHPRLRVIPASESNQPDTSEATPVAPDQRTVTKTAQADRHSLIKVP